MYIKCLNGAKTRTPVVPFIPTKGNRTLNVRSPLVKWKTAGLAPTYIQGTKSNSVRNRTSEGPVQPGLSLRDAVEPDIRGNVARFARKVGVPRITAWRWTLPADHPEHAVPRSHLWAVIEEATDHRWQPPYGAFNGKPPRRPRAQGVNIGAARKAAATRRRQGK